MVRPAVAFIVASAFASGVAGEPGQRRLTIDERVNAQEAIERVYYAHQLGATEPFATAVPRAVLTSKVDKYLGLSAALARRWHTPVTNEMLQRELARMVAGTKLPSRLLELYAALGNDPFLIKECLARPVLVERLTRHFDASDAAFQAQAPRVPVGDVEAVAIADDLLPMPSMDPSNPDGVPCVPDDTWDNGILDAVPDPRISATTLWTGSVMLIWGGFRTPSIWLGTGGRYDPATDSWTAITMSGAPVRRSDHASVWTGSEMIVWGGWDGGTTGALTSGGRYNPVSDTWTPTSTIGSPAGRQYPSGVWSGSEMIVWGGGNGTNTGGRYNPATDTWSPTSLVGAPSARLDHTAVWTGSRMVIWGGYFTNQPAVNTGGLYDPVTNTWTPTSTVGAPSSRTYHTAVWTGSRMIVWGGGNNSNTGGLYDPATNSWTPTSTMGAPVGRGLHAAVWTGSEMLVWGGSGVAPTYLNSGGKYDPTTDSWKPTTTNGAPVGRIDHGAVWTGSQMLVWGGWAAGSAPSLPGARYHAATDTWTPIAVSTAPAHRAAHTAVWTGSEMIVWGGVSGGSHFGDGARYDPATDHWTVTSATGAPAARGRHTAVWTGNRMVVWGGSNAGGLLGTGGRYDPVSDSWTPTSTTAAPSAREMHVAVWTGSRMIVWGGGSTTGGRYDPVGDSWTPTSNIGVPPAPFGAAVWTGSRMIVWGGDVIGGRYDPVSDSWLPTSPIGAPIPRIDHAATWSGNRMVVWGGYGQDDLGELDVLNTGGRYDPVSDTWAAITTAGAPSARRSASALDLFGHLAVWGGDTGAGVERTGARYDPAANTWTPIAGLDAPAARSKHTAVWTGSLMLVWGGNGFTGTLNSGGRYVFGAATDNDGDTVSECQGDCNDLDPAIYPTAIESCNTLDDNCDGQIDEDAAGVDTDGDAFRNACDDCPMDFDPAQSDLDEDGQGDRCDLDDGVIYLFADEATYRSWQAEAGFTSWNSYLGSLAVLRSTGEYTQAPGSNALAARDCGLAATTLFDPPVPGPGEVAFQLVTGVSGGVEGSLGTTSAGVPRPSANPCP